MDFLYGFLSDLPVWFSYLSILLALIALGFLGAPLLAWTLTIVVSFWLIGLPKLVVAIAAGVFAIAHVPTVRQLLFSSVVMKIIDKLKLMPAISETEKVALEAGSTWVDGELFSGDPDFNSIMDQPYQKLNEKEQSFLDQQVETLCAMVDDETAYEDGDLSAEVWAYLKQEKFFGLIIPPEYGGLGFSALGHSEVVSKLSSRSIPLSISCMVPNSLGPAELILHYGTQKQKDYYLPKLASGEEIPCFGLTEPQAGSDAGSMSSLAVLFKGDDENLYLRMNWRKRYITLGAVSTVIGLAVKLQDPDNLLGKGKDLGITCVLVPSLTQGVALGKRHDPLGVPFFNCPIEGKDVVVSVDQIIGGIDGAGTGWRMLMECLAAGRSISLPASSTGGSKKAARVSGAYAQVRQQFGLSIGRFEGVGDVLARIGGLTYLMDACRIYTAGAVDKGIKPSVVSAIVKYQTTELSRQLVNDAMDISGGAGISLGPKNLLAKSYIAAPIGITVEGANILTRTMIIFGQGAIRCHPYAYKEVLALSSGDLKAFDQAFVGHIGHVIKNTCRSLVLSVSRGRLAKAPKSPMAPYFRKLAWASASFAISADLAMMALGGSLKFKEKLTGRFADILSWMYLISSVLRRYEAEGRRKDHEAFVHYAVKHGFAQIQTAFQGIFENFDVPVLGSVLKYPVALWSRVNSLGSAPEDHYGQKIAKALMTPGALRDSITLRALYVPKDQKEALGFLEHAMSLSFEAEGIYKKISKAIADKRLSKGKPYKRVGEAQEKGVITSEEVTILERAQKVCAEAIEVDEFDVKSFKSGKINVHSQPKNKPKTNPEPAKVSDGIC